jgi:hypothetical protein
VPREMEDSGYWLAGCRGISLFHVKQEEGRVIRRVSRETFPEGGVGRVLTVEGVQLDVGSTGFRGTIQIEIEFRVPIQDQCASLEAPG